VLSILYLVPFCNLSIRRGWTLQPAPLPMPQKNDAFSQKTCFTELTFIPTVAHLSWVTDICRKLTETAPIQWKKSRIIHRYTSTYN